MSWRDSETVKVVTILGTRPEVIRLSRIIEKLDRLCDHVVIHTGQNYDVNLNDVFFHELGVRPPDHHLGARGTFGEQVATILSRSEQILASEAPDRFLVLGDTNSSLAAIMAKRLGIPVYHMEAGNRCFDDRVPEEVNRRLIDHSSDVLLPYTERSRANLLREGIPGDRIFVTGNPIYEVIQHSEPGIRSSTVLERLGVDPGGFLLVTLHRAENVDVERRLAGLTAAFDRLQRRFDRPVIVSTHPHTKARLASFGVDLDNPNVHFLSPFGFFDFITLERSAFCVLSDSGTVQEECAIFGVPNVTIRDVTERPETLERGSNVITGADPDHVELCVEAALQLSGGWSPPPEYVVPNVSETVIKILLGFRLDPFARG